MISKWCKWLVKGWFERPVVSVLESFFMRFFFALIAAYTLRNHLTATLTIEPNPVGLLRLLHKIDDHRTWLTWLADLETYGFYRAVLFVLLAFYVAGFALPVVLPVLAVMHILPCTLYDSQGYPHHGNQIVSLLLMVQTGTVWWHCIRGRRWSFSPPDAVLRAWLQWQSITLVAGTYFLSVITKMIESHGHWLLNANNFALDMIKTERQSWLNKLDSARAAIPPNALWMLEHPMTARFIFGSGMIMEAICIFAIGNRILGLIIGISLIVMHRSIDALMGGVAFQYNELLDFTYFVGLPFGLAWVMEKAFSNPVRWGVIIGAFVGVPISWFFQWAPPAHIATMQDYFLCIVNSLGVWASQEWGRFFDFLAPVFATSAVCGLLGAGVAVLISRKARPGRPLAAGHAG